MDLSNLNRAAWDRAVDGGNPYTIPVSAEDVAKARQGQWEIYLTDTKPIPKSWFPPLQDREVLCLAAGGGQQGPILAAAGARVTVFDFSPHQLAQDRFVAERDGLDLALIEGDMTDLSDFKDGQFDLIVHPIANVFIADVHPVWRECFRVLRPQGILMAGFMNPMEYLFDLYQLDNNNVFEVKHPLPFSGLTSLTEAERERYFGKDAAIEFSHTLEDQIDGQLRAGFALTAFFEERRTEGIIGKYMPSYFATRAVKGPSYPPD